MENLTGKPGRQGMEALLEIARIVQEQLQADGIPTDQARKVALTAADQVRQNYGGTEVYIPKGLALVLSERDRQIWDEFNGDNYHALAKKYDRTERQIRHIISRVRDEHDARVQLGLFSND